MQEFEIALLLRDVAETFRQYEAHHRAKASEAGRPEKAERNRVLAERCEEALRELGIRTDDPEALLRSVPDSLEALANRLRDAIAKRAPERR